MLTKEQFLVDVEEHEMQMLKNGVSYRHVLCTGSDKNYSSFEIITWPGHLCITGDPGTYVFATIGDLFSFFRSKELKINPGNSKKKLKSACELFGVKEFSFEAFRDRVKDYYDSFAEDNEDELGSLEMQKLWEEISESVLDEGEQGEFFAYHAVQEFEWTFHKDGVKLTFDFQDFFLDGGNTEAYTHHYIWCLYAIVWGINKYDKYKDSLSRK